MDLSERLCCRLTEGTYGHKTRPGRPCQAQLVLPPRNEPEEAGGRGPRTPMAGLAPPPLPRDWLLRRPLPRPESRNRSLCASLRPLSSRGLGGAQPRLICRGLRFQSHVPCQGESLSESDLGPGDFVSIVCGVQRPEFPAQIRAATRSIFLFEIQAKFRDTSCDLGSCC
ncbi:uncharacterized protein [Saccopteryx leptura]|uniref:uncharacterized protein isoform X3 n=1 Tax=Saccopteryx leptura TaxID=249018 RepID=UPI00339CCD08